MEVAQGIGYAWGLSNGVDITEVVCMEGQDEQ